MRLKQLEIKGFKSFASQTVVNFDADVIGIVGPNGSGKSNIVDAIRWVLGEQKGSELRLDKMASVIFNGTRKKKPGNLASVSLTFENDKSLLATDYTTVTVTRMLYRSGDSEYRLNGVQCRLKDIRNLFLDTGIGSNSYAIIALGMVDDILADKDNSRRRMFEQAAGISKYKDRKKESLRKLKNTEDDLDRIEDVLHEITNNLSSLEKQAKRARKYRDLKQQYRDFSLLLTGIRVEKLRLDHARLKEETAQAEESYKHTESRITELETQLDQERQRHVDKERLVGERQRKLNALVGELRGLENDQRLLQQRKTFIDQQTRKLAEEIRAASGQLETYATEIGQMTEQLGAEREKLTQREAARQEAEQALQRVKEGHAGLKSQLDSGLREQQQEERKVFELEKRRAINSNQVDNYRYQVDRNLEEMENRTKERATLESEIQQLNADESAAAAALADLETREAQRQQAIETAVGESERLQSELGRINRGLDARRNEYKLTKSMIDSLEGFPESIRYLSKNRSWTPDPQLLSDLLLVEPDYRAAIENFLEPYLNHYVVSSPQEAQAAIQLLADKQKGKAHFFILEAIPDEATAPTASPAGTRPAAEVVTVDAPFRKLTDRLLHGVYVTPEEQLPPQPADGVTILSSGGQYIRRAYSVSGGSVGLFEGKKIGRKKNLELLHREIREAEERSAALSRELEQQRSTLAELRGQRLDRQIPEKQRELNKLQQRAAGLQARAEGFQSYFTDTQAKNAQLQEEADKLVQLNREMDAELIGLRDRINHLRHNVAGTDEDYRRLSEELSSASAAYNQENILFIQQQNRVETLERELAFRGKRREELQRQEVTNREQLKSLEREAGQISQQEGTLERNIGQMRQEKEEYQATLSSAEKAYYDARSLINAREDELRRENRLRQDAQVKVNQLREKFTDVRFKLNGVEERLKIEFNLDLEQLAAVEVEEWTGTVTDLEIKVDRLRSRIGNYGEINPMAVEAYDEMKERHETITQQRDDIIAAKGTLLKTIKEIEDTATVQFLDAFERVRVFFIDVFRSLFTEDDNCDLILLDPENPLESGIEIVAKPKGKRPQTISQLSGGEKTLTATALLFALYLLKPAPFCIFDEVDAPLDDANIAKFNRIVKKFSRDSQFIIVTHNKLTMEAVDSIYGVYTTEQGGSGVVPVQFTELEGSTTFSAR
ncbi:chromosome segregation protein [Lewinella marina]|uniref:Chromosome partition protein Smc n=1 Tax=Neolewinella marina TaxID=438751 RepID=A0A2G0CI34_9BACT|nr:chromosome segregation protein SMC [Neolewinella marina]NJB85239.1 chromosome segregation protein [Neolewinella marina]PHK99629.1 chromosome segregation protein SMC [Neolewinella marina]